MRCAVFGCNNTNNKRVKKSTDTSVKYFSFPKNADLCKQWVFATKRSDKFNEKSSVICSKHFRESDYVVNLKHVLLNYSPKNHRGLKPDAVPTQNLPQRQVSSTSSKSAQNREHLAEKRQKTKIVNDLTKPTTATNETVQTEELHEGALLDDMRNKLASANAEIQDLKHQLAAVQNVFSSNQIKKLTRQRRINWSIAEISNAIALYAAGPRAYRLSLKKGLPYPAVSTLKQWLRKIDLNPGILKKVLKIAMYADMSEKEKVCTIVFDEMKIRREYVYDQPNDHLIQPYNYVQVVMISGVYKAWKQTVFYDFDCKMTTRILYEVITFVENSGFHVVAMVSDLGGANRGLHTALDISESKPYFTNPVTSEKIFVLADVPHLLKLIRNNFVDHGFLIGEKVVKKEIVEEVLKTCGNSDLKITHKMTIEKLNVARAQRQKVKFAAKLFSHTMSQAISRCGSLGYLPLGMNWIECSGFFKLVNDWFDIFNVSIPISDTRTRNRGYGLALEEQNSILDQMSNTIGDMRVIGSRSRLPFQTGILISNSALKMLLPDLNRRFQMDYLLTRRLNQDIIENFFGVIRAKGGLHDHPTCLEFKYRLRSYILGKNQGSYSDYSNVESDGTPDIPLSGNLIQKLNPVLRIPTSPDPSTHELSELEYDGLENLAGFICHKLQDSTLSSTSVDSNYSWIDHLNEGGLTKPSCEFMGHMEALNKVFLDVNGDGLTPSKNFIQNLLQKSVTIDCPEKAKRLFFRSRMFFRMRELNADFKNLSAGNKRKMNKIVH